MTIALEQQIASLYLNVKKSDVRLAGCILKMDEIFVLIDDIQVQGDDNNKNMFLLLLRNSFYFNTVSSKCERSREIVVGGILLGNSGQVSMESSKELLYFQQ